MKALAEQTAKATDQISQQIGGIQSATDQSVMAIREIGSTISRMSEIASTIASAVEEQGAATQEISRNVQQAAVGTEAVTTNIERVAAGARENGAAAANVTLGFAEDRSDYDESFNGLLDEIHIDAAVDDAAVPRLNCRHSTGAPEQPPCTIHRLEIVSHPGGGEVPAAVELLLLPG